MPRNWYLIQTKPREESSYDNLEDFKQISNIIVANRMVDELNDVKTKVYTRDIFKND